MNEEFPPEVHRSTVTIPLPAASDGRPLGEVRALIDEPDEPVGRILLLHGFGRGPAALDRLAYALARDGFWVMRPHLRSRPGKRGISDLEVMSALGFAVAAWRPTAGPLVVVGHSAGGAVAMRAAAQLVEGGATVHGVVLLDSNGNIERIMEPALTTLTRAGVPVRTVAAAPGPCNRQGQIVRWLAEQDLGFVGVLTSGTHCDAEDDKADATCRLLCGGAVNPADAAVLRALVVGWSRAWIRGTEDADLLPGGRRLQVWEDLDVIQVIH